MVLHNLSLELYFVLIFFQARWYALVRWCPWSFSKTSRERCNLCFQVDSNSIWHILVSLQTVQVVSHISNTVKRYHGHAEGQVQDGLYGTIIVK